jgi:catechol 2,3-dioxygenase-like lactoylglutathione lyase family enzyme
MPDLPRRREGTAYQGDVAFTTDGRVQFHLSTADHQLGLRMDQAVNPQATGHLAFRTDDIDAVKSRLKAQGVRYSDYGVWAMADWYQIFLFDPAGNVVEIQQELT